MDVHVCRWIRRYGIVDKRLKIFKKQYSAQLRNFIKQMINASVYDAYFFHVLIEVQVHIYLPILSCYINKKRYPVTFCSFCTRY